MNPEIEPLHTMPADLDALSLTANGDWIGLRSVAGGHELIYGGHGVAVPKAIVCRFPHLCALDAETAVLVDARTAPNRPNAWVVTAAGDQVAEFHVGDAVHSLVAVSGHLVVTHFDEGLATNRAHGALVFDRRGELVLDCGRDLPSSVDIVDCYAAAPVGKDSVLLYTYPGFPLSEVRLSTRSQRVWKTPDALHGAGAISADGPTLFFHSPYGDQAGMYAWQRGAPNATRVGELNAPLGGLPGGWFLGRVGGEVARVRFSAPASY